MGIGKSYTGIFNYKIFYVFTKYINQAELELLETGNQESFSLVSVHAIQVVKYFEYHLWKQTL